jgi:GalNAc5-diNAcBac-PP-undecaprenol beta-1,3-glucosyltransferase
MTAPVRATVVIPTHDRGAALVHSAGSALAQTVEELEVFVVGDGVADTTRDVVADLCHRDKRIRFFDNPKGAGHGEVHRHAALSEARGRIVCYLSDDDLWLPDHVETLEDLLGEAEFAHTLPASIQPDQTFSSQVGDLDLAVLRDRMLEGGNFVPLSCAGHRLSTYRQLLHGWRPPPEGLRSDLHMWQQFLGNSALRFRTSGKITVVQLRAGARTSWSPDERLAEQETWALRLGDERFRDELVAQAATYFRQESVRTLVSQLDWKSRAVKAEGALSQLHVECGATIQQLGSDIRQAIAAAQAQQRQVERLETRLTDLAASAEAAAMAGRQVEQELARTRATLTWRVRDRLVGFDAVQRAVRFSRRVRTGG